ncbi:unnamed protein product [Malus baccata var. baccata]
MDWPGPSCKGIYVEPLESRIGRANGASVPGLRPLGVGSKVAWLAHKPLAIAPTFARASACYTTGV